MMMNVNMLYGTPFVGRDEKQDKINKIIEEELNKMEKSGKNGILWPEQTQHEVELKTTTSSAFDGSNTIVAAYLGPTVENEEYDPISKAMNVNYLQAYQTNTDTTIEMIKLLIKTLKKLKIEEKICDKIIAEFVRQAFEDRIASCGTTTWTTKIK